ncbi:YceI family protein [Candidatus Sodalis sp. SoCistrobi]|uniref:YceI family protein n=1 Tax=Candidatus Sodalis sp. SoCistrobi TaxID=1922216 RepID=UPI00093C6A0C|nr:YceI family protein [Candidatus Sodalis sp. SoCistrobi]
MITMKKTLLPLATGLLLASGFAQAKTETYHLDPSHTSLVFSWNHFGFSNPTADFSDITGTIVLDDAAIENAKVDVTIPVKTVDTHVQALTDEFKGEKYFDQKQFPNATFHSTKIVSKGDKRYQVYGNLTIKGISRPVILDAVLNKQGEHPMAKKATVGFNATTTIKRSEFKMGQFVPNVSDDVTISISTEALAK